MKAQRLLPIECYIFVPLADSKGVPRTKYRCDDNLLCERCRKCLEHCECGPAQRSVTPPVKNRKPDYENQIPLCDKPELRYK